MIVIVDYEPCAMCGGDVPAANEGVCQVCNGEGKLPVIECPTCSGKGYVADTYGTPGRMVECSDCKGEGCYVDGDN